MRLPPPGEQNPAACVVGGLLPAILVGAVSSVVNTPKGFPPGTNFALIPTAVKVAHFQNYAGLFYAYTLLQCPFRLLRSHNIARVDSLTDHMIAGGAVGALGVHLNRIGIPWLKDIDVELLVKRWNGRIARPQVAFFVYGHCAAFLHAIGLFVSGQFVNRYS